jgi:hypothetical protein
LSNRYVREMTLNDKELDFLAKNQTAAMITVTPDGIAKPTRVGVVVVEGKIWSSGTQDRVRTKRLRRDPRATLFVFESGYRWLGLEATVSILEGPRVADESVQLFRTMQKRPTGPLSWFSGELDEDAFRAMLIEEERLIYEFEVHRSYGVV